MFKWVKSTYYDVVPAKIIKANQLEDSKVEMWYKLPEGGLERVVASRGYLYVYLVKLGAMCYMPIDFKDRLDKPTRKKLWQKYGKIFRVMDRFIKYQTMDV